MQRARVGKGKVAVFLQESVDSSRLHLKKQTVIYPLLLVSREEVEHVLCIHMLVNEQVQF